MTTRLGRFLPHLRSPHRHQVAACRAELISASSIQPAAIASASAHAHLPSISVMSLAASHASSEACTAPAPLVEMAGFVQVASLSVLSESARHHITLRHRESGEYHNLLLFTFPPAAGAVSDTPRLYCMEASCPHVGAPLENAHVQPADLDSDVDEPEVELTDVEDMVVVCPWHEYDFNLRTGESSHGLNACVYEVKTVESPSAGGGRTIWIEAPKPHDATSLARENDWELVERRPVSESFSRQYASLQSRIDPSEDMQNLSISPHSTPQSPPTSFAANVAAVSAPDPAPSTLVEWACLVLRSAEPARKVAYTQQAVREFRAGKIRTIGGGLPRARSSDDRQPAYRASAQVPDGQGWMPPLPERDEAINQAYDQAWEWRRPPSQVPPHTPPREDNTQMLDPTHMARRGKGGSQGSRIKMLHSLANIELWAIDLAWDIIARGQELAHRHAFAYFHATEEHRAPKLPPQFFSDFAKVAEDEAKHFSLLQERLWALDNIRFGQMPIHASLWDSALETCHSLTARLSIIHLVHEARGLDVNPQTIAKFARAKDEESTAVLNIIHMDEVTHVAAGHRWLTWLCHHSSVPNLNPVQVFRDEVKYNFVGRLKGPFNAPDRAKAGMVRLPIRC